MPTPAEVTKVILDLIPEYLADPYVLRLAKEARSKPDPYDINCGLCDEFCRAVCDALGGETDEFQGMYLEQLGDDFEETNHCVIALKYGKHWLYFDSECPYGTNDPKRIPVFANMGKHTRSEVIKARRRRFKKIDQFIENGTEKFFEYHCNESHDSGDAPIWYHSHQKCVVIACHNANDDGDMKQKNRFELGHQLIYRLRFADGFEWDCFEDELLDSEAEYQRPDPPKGPTDLWMKMWANGHKPQPEWLASWCKVYLPEALDVYSIV